MKILKRLKIFSISLILCFNSIFYHSPVFADENIPNGITGAILLWMCGNGITFGSNSFDVLQNILETAYGTYIVSAGATSITSEQIQKGISVTNNNKLKIDSTVSNWCNNFIQWFKNSYTTGISDSGFSNNISIPISSTTKSVFSIIPNDLLIKYDDTNSFSIHSDHDVYIIVSSRKDTSYPYDISLYSLYDYVYKEGSYSETVSTIKYQIKGSYRTIASHAWYSKYTNDYPLNTDIIGLNYDQLLTYVYNNISSYAPELPLIDMNLNVDGSLNDLKDVVLNNDQATLIDDPIGLKDVINAINSLVGIDQGIADQIADDIKVQPLDPAIPSTYPLNGINDNTTVIDDTTYNPPSDATVESYKVVGLENVFPFSIPFDLYYLTQKFVGDPVTPSFPFKLKIDGIVDYEQNCDLSAWDNVASVFRSCEAILFIGSLIIITRNIIRG